ncbi:hypothetical protein DM44_7038 [Burkholderia cepacia]|nr:hypothetical protein DM42_6482 [Burkholderia cepacia]KGC04972.1 hypothetical protein DM44_7038 [Burkholderia cepacia]
MIQSGQRNANCLYGKIGYKTQTGAVSDVQRMPKKAGRNGA